MSVLIQGVFLVGVTTFVVVQTIRGKIKWSKFFEEISKPKTSTELFQQAQTQAQSDIRDRQRYSEQLKRDDNHSRTGYYN